MKRIIVIAYITVLISIPHAHVHAATDTTKTSSSSSLVSSLKDSASKGMSEASKQLSLFLNALKELGTRLGQLKYDQADKIEILTSQDQQKAMGFVINFKDKGHGALDNLNGFALDIRFGSTFDSLGVLANPIRDQAVSGIKSLVGGTPSTDPETGRPVLMGNATMEFIFKAMILARNYADKDPVSGIDEKVFGMEMALLLARLAKTPGVKDVKDALKAVPGPLRSIMQGIKISGKSLEEYLSSLWEEIKFAVTYDFTKKDSTQIDNSDIPTVVRVMSAIICRAAIDYTFAKDVFFARLSEPLKNPETLVVPEEMEYLEKAENAEQTAKQKELSEQIEKAEADKETKSTSPAKVKELDAKIKQLREALEKENEAVTAKSATKKSKPATQDDYEVLKESKTGKILGLDEIKDLKDFWTESKKIEEKKEAIFEKIAVARKNKQIAIDTKKADTEKKLLPADVRGLDDVIKKADTEIKKLADDLKKVTAELDKQFKKLPVLSKIKSEAQKRVIQLVSRFGAYRKLREKIIAKVGPIVDVILIPLGLSLDMLLPGDEKIPADKQAMQEAEEAELAGELLGDDIFGEDSYDLGEEETEGTEETPIDELAEDPSATPETDVTDGSVETETADIGELADTEEILSDDSWGSDAGGEW